MLFRYQLVSLCVRNPEVTKETILKKAGILFNTNGYKATSLSHITEATGLTKGAIYQHFESKDVLERETLIYLSSLLFGKLRELIKREHSAGDKLRSVFNFFESYTINPPLKGGCPLLNAAIEADDANESLRIEATKMLGQLHESLVLILSNGIKHKQIKATIDKEHYATLFIAMLEGGIMMSKLHGNAQAIRRVLKHLNLLLTEIEL